MDIRLAGFNVEKDILEEIDPRGSVIGPEVFSAAYARISRSEKTIEELRQEARSDIEKARKSNERIIFGMGHHSVAEHAVFNFDLMEISRLALEALEQFRLVSYTERSQRYVTLKESWIIPEEVAKAGLEESFGLLAGRLYDFYQSSFSVLARNLAAGTGKPAGRAEINELECRAKEDARYILPLAFKGQVGMTINARNLEHLFRRFHLSPLREVGKIGEELYRLVERIAPSLILFSQPSLFESRFSGELACEAVSVEKPAEEDGFNLRFFEIPEDGDDTILALLMATKRHLPVSSARAEVARLGMEEKKRHFRDLFQNMEFFDAPPRHFEFASVSFEATVSASCFAQLKRHRMASLMAGPYSPEYGVSVPDQIRDAGLSEEFKALIDEVEHFYEDHWKKLKNASGYILTNAHRKRVLMRFNLRDLYHFIRLRADAHAQWEIRNLAQSIEDRIRETLPLTSMMLSGKDRFSSRLENLTRE